MFLTLSFTEHMLPWGLKLSWPWPFVALWSLSCTKGWARWGRGKGEGRGPKGQEEWWMLRRMLAAGRWSSEPGKTQGSAPARFLPPHFTHTPPSTATSHWPRPGPRFLSPFEVVQVPGRWLTPHSETDCPTLSGTSHAETAAGWLCAGPGSQQRTFLSRWSAVECRFWPLLLCILLQSRWCKKCKVFRGMKRRKIS